MDKSYLFLSIAIFFNAVMDTIQFHPESWICKWEFMVIKEKGMFGDGWHISKQLMFLFILLTGMYLPDNYNIYLTLLGFSLVILIVHTLFFHIIFKL